MKKACNKKPTNNPKLTVGVLVESLEPSEFKGMVKVSIVMLLAAFSLGVYVTTISYEWDKKAHIAADGLEQLKHLGEIEEMQRKAHDAEAAAEKWKTWYEESQKHHDDYRKENALTPRLFRKESADIMEATKLIE